MRAGSAGRALQASMSGRAGAGGRAGARSAGGHGVGVRGRTSRA